MLDPSFEKMEVEIKTLTKQRLLSLYPIYWQSLDIIISIVNLLTEEISSSEDVDDVVIKHNKGVLILLSRSIQHLESIRLLIEAGLYGDCFSLSRNVMSDLSTAEYLFHHPEFLDLFLSERQDDYQLNKAFKKAFSESAIEADRVKRGHIPNDKAFQMLSKTSHASSFGAQLYWTKNHIDGTHHLKYEPKFEEEKALLLGNLLLTAHLDFAAIILSHRHQRVTSDTVTPWLEIEKAYEDLKVSSVDLEKVAIARVNNLWPSRKRRTEFDSPKAA